MSDPHKWFRQSIEEKENIWRMLREKEEMGILVDLTMSTIGMRRVEVTFRSTGKYVSTLITPAFVTTHDIKFGGSKSRARKNSTEWENFLFVLERRLPQC